MKLHEWYLLAIGLTNLNIVFVSAYAWRYRRYPGINYYLLLNFCTILYNTSFYAVTVLDDPFIAYGWIRVRFVMQALVNMTAIFFLLRFIRRPAWIGLRFEAMMWGLCAVLVWSMLVPSADRFMFWEWDLVRLDGYSVEARVIGPVFHLNIMLQGLTAFIVVYLITDYALRVDSTWRRSMLVIIPPIIIMSLGAATQITLGPEPGLRLTPIMISVVSITIGWSFARYNTIDILPVAYDRILASVHDAVLVLNPEHYVVGFNPAAEQLLGLGRSALMNLRLESMVGFPSIDQLGGDSKVTFEHLIGQRLCEIDSVPLVTRRGAMGRVLVIRDITARKRAEQEALALAFERERAAILASFLRDASHEFRTPLTVIKSSLYLAGRQADADKRAKHLDQIDGQIGRLTRLIDDLQIMSRLDSTPSLTLTLTDLTTFVRTLWEKTAASFPDRRFEGDIPAQAIRCEFDPSYLEQALTRLIDNAIRYSGRDSVIRLALSSVNRQARITLQDHGIGMDAETLAKATQRFYRKDQAHTTAGFGLGVSIAKAIIELHSGTLTLTSTVGQGTTIQIDLPLAADVVLSPPAAHQTAISA